MKTKQNWEKHDLFMHLLGLAYNLQDMRVSNLCGMRKMQRFLQLPIWGVLTDPKLDKRPFRIKPNTITAPRKNVNTSIKLFWHSICMKSNSQNFVDWRAI